MEWVLLHIINLNLTVISIYVFVVNIRGLPFEVTEEAMELFAKKKPKKIEIDRRTGTASVTFYSTVDAFVAFNMGK